MNGWAVESNAVIDACYLHLVKDARKILLLKRPLLQRIEAAVPAPELRHVKLGSTIRGKSLAKQAWAKDTGADMAKFSDRTFCFSLPANVLVAH